MGVANNFGCFFLSGLPGGLDYVMLVLVRGFGFGACGVSVRMVVFFAAPGIRHFALIYMGFRVQ
jgi:hypothetical protein